MKMDGWKLEDYSMCIYIYIYFLVAQNTYFQLVFAVSFRESLFSAWITIEEVQFNQKEVNQFHEASSSEKHGEKLYGFPTYPSSVGVKEFRPIFTTFVWRLFRHVSDTTKEGIQFAYWLLEDAKFEIWGLNCEQTCLWHLTL